MFVTHLLGKLYLSKITDMWMCRDFKLANFQQGKFYIAEETNLLYFRVFFTLTTKSRPITHVSFHLVWNNFSFLLSFRESSQ